MNWDKYVVKLTRQVQEDLKNLKDYLTEELHEPEYSDKTMLKISNAIRSLDIFPYRAPVTEYLQGYDTEIHKLVSGKNLIYYCIYDFRMTVYIILISNSKQHQETLLKKRFDERNEVSSIKAIMKSNSLMDYYKEELRNVMGDKVDELDDAEFHRIRKIFGMYTEKEKRDAIQAGIDAANEGKVISLEELHERTIKQIDETREMQSKDSKK